MEIFTGYEAATGWTPKPVLALGNFDGVHLGHRHLLEQAADTARQIPDRLIAFTFDPHPATIFSSQPPVALTSLARKLALLGDAGVDATIVQPFTPQFYSLSAAAFIENVLVKGLRVSGVCVGYDYTFGQGRQGTTEVLLQAGVKSGFDVQIIPAFHIDGTICSSTEIRARLAAGDIAQATRLLGRPPELEGQVIRGAGRGKTLGFPTANLNTRTLLQTGVYGGIGEIVGEKKRWPVAVNVGKRPTFAGEPFAIEVHLIGFTGDLYGKNLRIGLLDRIRDERRFASPEELMTQIKTDVEISRERGLAWLEANRI